MKDAERHAALADKANKHRKQAKKFVEEVGEATTRKQVVGAQNNKMKKKQLNPKESEKETMQVYDKLTDSGKIESADDDICFEPTEDADATDNNDDDDEGVCEV